MQRLSSVIKTRSYKMPFSTLFSPHRFIFSISSCCPARSLARLAVAVHSITSFSGPLEVFGDRGETHGHVRSSRVCERTTYAWHTAWYGRTPVGKMPATPRSSLTEPWLNIIGNNTSGNRKMQQRNKKKHRATTTRQARHTTRKSTLQSRSQAGEEEGRGFN